MPDSQTLCFLDTETTGLDRERHEVWEIGFILRRPDSTIDEEHLYALYPNLAVADPFAMKVNKYFERTRDYYFGSGASNMANRQDLAAFWSNRKALATKLQRLLHGVTIVGAVPGFDDHFVAKFMRENGQLPTWHYHLMDVENLAVGFLLAQRRLYRNRGINTKDLDSVLAPPWNSHKLSAAVGVEEPPDSEKHTALGDARWARDIWDKVYGNV